VSVRAGYFDVGCVLMDETPTWRAWERHLGAPEGALSDALERAVARGAHHVFMEAGVRPLFREGELVSSSESWRVEKPAPAFFARVVAEAGTAPPEIAYVGDRVDNDVLPALEAGMVAVHLRRGPWGIAHARRPEAARAHLRLDSLTQLPEALARL
jgi:FMN phosphatase YigB (HAD superfamily)